MADLTDILMQLKPWLDQQQGSPEAGMVAAPLPPASQVGQKIYDAKASDAEQPHPWADVLQGFLGGFNSKVNPHYYQQQMENERQRRELAQRLFDRQNPTAYEKAQLAHQEEVFKEMQKQHQQASDFQQAQSDAAQQKEIIEGVASGKLTPAQNPSPMANLPTTQTSVGPQGELTQSQSNPFTQILGGQAFNMRQPRANIPIPSGKEFDDIRQLFPDGIPDDEKHLPMLSHLTGIIQTTAAKAQDLSQHRQGIQDIVDRNIKEVMDASELDDKAKKHWMDELHTAALSDGRKVGPTSELHQVQEGIRKAIDAPRLRQEKLNDQKMMLQFAAVLREGPGAEPEAIKQAVDMIHENYDNLEVIVKMKGSDKTFMRALGDEFIARGESIDKISTALRDARDFAKVAQPKVTEAYQMLNQLEKEEKLGVFISRYNNFLQGKIGSTDPEYARFNDLTSMLQTVITKIHSGLRGASSAPIIARMESQMSAKTMDPGTFRAGLDNVKDWIDSYAKAGLHPKQKSLTELLQGVGKK